MIYIKSQEEYTICQDIPDSSSTDDVSIKITRLSDGYTWDFDEGEFASANNTGSMEYISDTFWQASFTPPQNDTYLVLITDTTLSKSYTQILKSVAGAEVYGFIAQTKVAICNFALRQIGVDTILSLDEESEQTRVLNATYDFILKEVLRAHPWNFAIRRTSLAQLDETPAFGYTYAYQLPFDCLRVISMQEDDMEFEIEGRKLLTDEATAKIKYIALITDPNEYDSAFVSAFATRLASEIAFPLTNNINLANEKYKEYLEKLSLAKSTDAQEGTPQKIEDNEWVDERE